MPAQSKFEDSSRSIQRSHGGDAFVTFDNAVKIADLSFLDDSSIRNGVHVRFIENSTQVVSSDF